MLGSDNRPPRHVSDIFDVLVCALTRGHEYRPLVRYRWETNSFDFITNRCTRCGWQHKAMLPEAYYMPDPSFDSFAKHLPPPTTPPTKIEVGIIEADHLDIAWAKEPPC